MDNKEKIKEYEAHKAPVPSYEEWQELKEASDGLSNLMSKSLMNRFIKADEEKERLAEENQQLKGYNEYLRNIIIECEPYIENVCTALNMEKFANGGFLYKSNEVLSKIRTIIGEKKWKALQTFLELI